MNPRPFHTCIGIHLTEGMIIVLLAMSLLLFFLVNDRPKAAPEKPKIGKNGSDSHESALDKLEVGKGMYVCGCPMMCCNTISLIPNRSCACNFPLQKGIISKIHSGMIVVNASGREKIIFYTKKK